jgi:CHAT domain-containing protein/tetratricopeptide (TPR) repeat protein
VDASHVVNNLLTATHADRDRLLREAASTPDAVSLLLDHARNDLASAPEEALRIAQLAEEVAGLQTDGRAAANASRVQAQALRLLGRHADALDVFARAASYAQSAGDARLAAQVQVGRIDSLGWLGRYDEAVALAKQLQTEFNTMGAEDEAAKVLVNLGSLHFRRDEYVPALDCYQRATEVLARTGDAAAEAIVRMNSANILTNLNRVDEALELYDKAWAAFEQAGRKREAAVVDLNVGWLHYVSGKHSAALASLSRARNELQALGRELEVAKCDADMADVYRALNLYPEALECAERAIRSFAAIPLDYERARTEIGRAAVLMYMNRREEVTDALDRADAIFKAQRNRLQRAHVKLMRAYLLSATGRTEEARVDAWSAARTFLRLGQRCWAAEARFILAEDDLEQGRSATRAMASIARTAREHLSGWLECRAERALARYYLRQGRRATALRHLRTSVAVLEQARTLVVPEEMHVAFLGDKLSVYEDLVAALLARRRPADVVEALDVVERSKSRLLLERVQSSVEERLSGESSAVTEAQARLTSLRAELSRGYHRLHSFDEMDRQRLAGGFGGSVEELLPVERAYRQTLRQVELAGLGGHASALSNTVIPPVSALQSCLAADECLLEFYITAGQISCFLVRTDSLEVWYNIAPLSEVERAARRLRYHLQKTGMVPEYAERHTRQLQSSVHGVLAQLYDLLIAPLAASLATEKVIVVPHGALHGLPFHAFFDGEGCFLDRYEVVYAPSASVWYTGVKNSLERKGRRGLSSLNGALVIGVPGPGIERVSAEVEDIARLLPTAEVYVGKDATVEAFNRSAAAANVIHLATHALFREDNPLFSGLRMADGWVLARDLYNMKLDCDLATLSACRTGVTYVEPGDELFGLVRGFLSAGARTVAASLWPAADAATAALMTRFYALLSEGMSKATALRAAQREIRDEYPHPYHWAAFALVGER